MKSPVKVKVMQILLDGNPHTETELANGAGFTKVASIQRWIRSFENARFIVRRPTGRRGEFNCQIVISKETVRRIYSYPEFRQLRSQIRMAPWFAPLFAGSFGALPGNLPELIPEMIRESHSFFEIIAMYDTPEKVMETYQPCLYVNELEGIQNEEFNTLCLYYQLYVQSIVRDIPTGGLGRGFMNLVRDVQLELGELHRKCRQAGSAVHGA